MFFFDCNCSYGNSGRPPIRYASCPDELLAEMDWCGIDRALPYHAGMRFDSPLSWNAQIIADMEGHARLQPSWALLPDQTGEFPPADTLLAMMSEHDVQVLRAFPDESRYRLDRRTFSRLLSLLTACRVPLFVKQNLLAIGELLSEFPDLLVVAMNVGPHSLERYLRPLLDEFPALHIESSHYMVEGLIEEFVQRYGPERLLFGSGYPDICSGAALMRLQGAEISETDRVAIAGGNLMRLLSEVRI